MQRKLYTLLITGCLASWLFSCAEDEMDRFISSQQPTTKHVSEADVVLHWDKEEQTMDGFGVAQAGWAHYLYAHRKREEVLNLLFGKEGLHLNILRGEVFPYYWKSEGETSFHVDADVDLSLDDPFFFYRL